MRLLDNFTFYVQTDDEGSEELVDLQDFTKGLMLTALTSVMAVSAVHMYTACHQPLPHNHVSCYPKTYVALLVSVVQTFIDTIAIRM